MKFETYQPCDILKPFIRSFAIAEITREHTYTVLPDTGLIICLQYKVQSSFRANHLFLPSSGLTGLQDSYRTYSGAANMGSVLIRFKAGGAAAFFKQPMHEIFGGSILLDDFMRQSELILLEEQLCEAATDIEKISIIEAFLIARLQHDPLDELVTAAMKIIHSNSGNIRIKELMQQLYISQSALEKRFRQVVGASPKKFSMIVRFKHFIENYNPQVPLSDQGWEAGFYDQAHFIKTFKSFTGETPETFFSKR